MGIAKIYDYCRALTSKKQDFIVVGSLAMYLHALSNKMPNDIDIVVRNFKELEGVKSYLTPSPFSGSGKRGYILSENMIKIDIFVEYQLPSFQIIEGIRVIDQKSMRDYYENLLPKVAEHRISEIKNNIALLWQIKI